MGFSPIFGGFFLLKSIFPTFFTCAFLIGFANQILVLMKIFAIN